MKIYFKIFSRPLLPLILGSLVAVPVHIFLGDIRTGFTDAVPIRPPYDRKPVEINKNENISSEIVEAEIR